MTYRAWTLKQFDRAALKDLTAAIAEQNTQELEMNAMDDEPWSEQKYAATLAAQQKGSGLAGGHPCRPRHHRPHRGADPAGGGGRTQRPHASDRHGQSMCPHPRSHRQGTDHRCLRRLRRGRRDRHRLALPAPQGDGCQRQMYAAQPGGATATAFRKTPSSPSTTRAASSS